MDMNYFTYTQNKFPIVNNQSRRYHRFASIQFFRHLRELMAKQSKQMTKIKSDDFEKRNKSDYILPYLTALDSMCD